MESDLFETDKLFDKYHSNEASEAELKKLISLIIEDSRKYEWCVEVSLIYRAIETNLLRIN